MARILHKIKSKKAETLVETLISALIAVLSVSLLATAIVASARMNHTAKLADEKFYNDLKSAEALTGGHWDGKAKISYTLTEGDGSTTNVEKEVDVIYYGNQSDGFFAFYQKKP